MLYLKLLLAALYNLTEYPYLCIIWNKLEIITFLRNTHNWLST